MLIKLLFMLNKNLFFFFLLFIFYNAEAQNTNGIKLPVIFSDNMVIQEGIRAPVWGTSQPSAPIKIAFAGSTVQTKAGADGRWMVKMPVKKAGGPFTMKITTSDQSVVFNNVMVGEVWICSGQSNMEMPLAGWGKIRDFEKEIAAANYPGIRLLQVQHNTSTIPLTDVKVDGGQWQVCSPQTIANFSAVAYFFARNIYEKKPVAIGLIHSSWGGTIAEAWTSGVSLKKMPAFAKAVEKMESTSVTQSLAPAAFAQQFKTWQENVMQKDSGYTNNKPSWASQEFDASSWKTMSLPGVWEKAGLPDFDGIAWFRKTITVPENWSGKDLRVSLGPVDDDDITFFNGTQVGRTEGYNKPRLYTIPAALVKAGENVLTVRVIDNSGDGGMYGEPKQLFIKQANGDSVSLAGEWQYKVGVVSSALPARPVVPEGPNRTMVLYNAMINPLIPYGIRGAIWYQGESNAGRAYQYKELFPLMIKDWREHWRQGDFPFYFVQLANFNPVKPEPGESDWAELREAQLKTLTLPNTGMAVIIDIGEAKDIHPKNKQDVGARLALIARANLYGEKVPYTGPVYQSSKVEGNTIRISFTGAEGGLVSKGSDTLKGFAIAGADKKFYWATARIEGNDIVVSSGEVTNPAAVRYAWANNPVCNLYDKAGLPASPFRTDDWEMITRKKE